MVALDDVGKYAELSVKLTKVPDFTVDKYLEDIVQAEKEVSCHDCHETVNLCRRRNQTHAQVHFIIIPMRGRNSWSRCSMFRRVTQSAWGYDLKFSSTQCLYPYDFEVGGMMIASTAIMVCYCSMAFLFMADFRSEWIKQCVGQLTDSLCFNSEKHACPRG